MMAVNMQEYMEKIEDELQCAVCLNLYRCPKILPCQHTFCKEPCIKELINSETEQITCPICREDHTLTLDGIDGLMGNV